MQNHNIQTLLDTEIDAVGGGLTAQVPTSVTTPSSILCWITNICGDRPPIINIGGPGDE